MYVSVLDYGRTRVRKSVFRICQNRTKFTNTLASCLLFRKSRSPILLSTPNSSFSHTIFTAAPQQEEAMGVWTTVPEECSLLSFCCSFASLAHCCWDTLSLGCRSDHTQIALLLVHFSTRESFPPNWKRPGRKLFPLLLLLLSSQ